MRPSIKDYFSFNKSERRGTISLVGIIILTLLLKQGLILFNPDSSKPDVSLDSLKIELERRYSKIETLELNESKLKSQTSKQINLFEFNPNKLSIKKWTQLGLSEKQAATIKKYEEKGGSFKIKSDVEKMYTISSEQFLKLKPYILLPDSIEDYKDHSINYNNREIIDKKELIAKTSIKVFINSADTSELKKLYGIGDYYSMKIVEYREALGGFVSKSQLKEIWGLKSETLENLDSNLVLDQIEIRKININEASIDELKVHPYIFWKVANSIVKYRNQHGNYSNLNELKKSPLISDSLLNKLEPYLEY